MVVVNASKINIEYEIYVLRVHCGRSQFKISSHPFTRQQSLSHKTQYSNYAPGTRYQGGSVIVMNIRRYGNQGVCISIRARYSGDYISWLLWIVARVYYSNDL